MTHQNPKAATTQSQCSTNSTASYVSQSLCPFSHQAQTQTNPTSSQASLQGAFAALTSPSDSSAHSSHDHIHGLEHLPHCFDYLRQAIMCAGDTALEEALVVPGLGSEAMPTRNVDGWGTTHLCRDWGVMWEFAKGHRYRNSSGII